jgi:hypothetical protein
VTWYGGFRDAVARGAAVVRMAALDGEVMLEIETQRWTSGWHGMAGRPAARCSAAEWPGARHGQRLAGADGSGLRADPALAAVSAIATSVAARISVPRADLSESAWSDDPSLRFRGLDVSQVRAMFRPLAVPRHRQEKRREPIGPRRGASPEGGQLGVR